MPEIKDILTEWFGGPALDYCPSQPLQKRWFAATPKLDKELACKYSGITNRALSGQLAHWRNSLEGELALLLLCDQFARNIYRGTHLAFQGDSLALDIAETLLRSRRQQNFGPFQQIFIGMPLEHSEDISVQQHSVAYFYNLLQKYESDGSIAPNLATHYRYALAHKAIIEQFGRYPHRNVALGRKSTKEEKHWLAQGGGFK